MELRSNAEARRFILEQIEPWAGSPSAALLWYQGQRISALGGLTPEQLVGLGRGSDVLEYLRHINDGGCA